MILTENTPDIVLAELLNGKVKVQISAKQTRVVKAYAQSMQPQTTLGEEFITIQNNGKIESLTRPFGMYRGNLALAVYCKTNADGTAKHKRVSSIIAQCVKEVHCKKVGDFFYELNPSNIITPTTTNLTNGYSVTILNIEWHS